VLSLTGTFGGTPSQSSSDHVQRRTDSRGNLRKATDRQLFSSDSAGLRLAPRPDVASRGLRLARAITVLALVAGQCTNLVAQSVEITPFGGYRFGGDFFELLTRQPVDLAGAPALGIAVDVPLYNGLQIEGLFTHEHANVTTSSRPLGDTKLWQMTVDHWQAGGLQEFSDGRTRPFLTGMFGLTRYAAEADSEFRFTLSAGGGVKMFPSRHVGVRLDGRVFATFVDASGSLIACVPGACFIALNADVVWQAEFTAGAVFRF
jgi:hypothetical protein